MKIDHDVMNVLAAARLDGDALTLTGQLDRTLYGRTNAVIEAAGGKWSRRDKAHIFAGEAAMALEQVFATGEITTSKELGFFETQGAALDMLITAARIERGMTVLEPSAGAGAIAQRARSLGAKLYCIEIDPARARLLEAAQFEPVICGDFLQMAQVAEFDRVSMNPPFAVPSDRRADLAHVRHAFGFLKPGGRLAAIMSAGISFRQDGISAAFRAWADARHAEWTLLPAGAFKASGTGVDTVLLTLDKDA